MAILILLNNYFHDLATAVLGISSLSAWLLLRSEPARRAPEILRPVARTLYRVGLGALAWTLAGGVVRALAYRRYEWMEAAGRGQVAALVVKHVLLVSMVILGLCALWRVHRLAGGAAAPEGNA